MLPISTAVILEVFDTGNFGYIEDGDCDGEIDEVQG